MSCRLVQLLLLLVVCSIVLCCVFPLFVHHTLWCACLLQAVLNVGVEFFLSCLAEPRAGGGGEGGLFILFFSFSFSPVHERVDGGVGVLFLLQLLFSFEYAVSEHRMSC